MGLTSSEREMDPALRFTRLFVLVLLVQEE